MNQLIDRAPQIDAQVYELYLDDLRIDNAMYGGTAHFSPRTRSVALNIKKDAAGGAYSVPYQTVFHELFHNIDYLAGEKLGTLSSFSHVYKNNIFSKTLKAEAEKHIERFMKAKTLDGMTTTRSKATATLMQELRTIEPINRSALSDIFHGASNGAVHAGFGHFTRGYWKRSGALSKESFANMASANITNPNAAKIIKKYFPESVKIYNEMLAEILKGGKR